MARLARSHLVGVAVEVEELPLPLLLPLFRERSAVAGGPRIARVIAELHAPPGALLARGVELRDEDGDGAAEQHDVVRGALEERENAVRGGLRGMDGHRDVL